MNVLPVVLSADNNYAQHMAVTIASLLYNLSGQCSVHFYILDGGLSEGNKQKIENLKVIKHFTIEYIKINIDELGVYECNLPHLSVASYFRLKLPSILPNLDKVLYLDSDIVVNGDISPIFSINLNGFLLAAVQDPYTSESYKQSLDITGLYFNAGVLLFNLAEMRL